MGRLIWLASYPKSGNTWMRAFLHNLLRDSSTEHDINRLGEFSYSDSTINFYQTHLDQAAHGMDQPRDHGDAPEGAAGYRPDERR